MSIKNIAVSKGTIYRIHPKDIREGDNCRQDYGDITELSKSIVECGLKKALEGSFKDGVFTLSDGHRRFRAIQKAIESGHEFVAVDCINKPKATEETRLMDQLTCNSGKPFTPIEQAAVIQRLINLGWKQKDIAKNLGKSVPHIYQMEKINNLPQKAKNLVHENIASVSFILQVLSDCDNDEQQFSSKLDEIEAQFKSTGEKVTKKKSKILEKPETPQNQEVEPSQTDGVEVIAEEKMEGEGFYTDPDDEKSPSNKVSGDELEPAIPDNEPEEPKASKKKNNHVIDEKDGFEIEDYQLILGDAKELIFTLAQYAEDSEQERAAKIIERIERYL